MFGSTPGTFKNLNAACKAALAFAEEESNEWTVVRKDTKTINSRVYTFYRPCRKEDIEEAKLDDWFEVI